VIEPTDEMERVFRDAWMKSMAEDPRSDDPERIADRAGLAAVLAIVERDYAVYPLCPAEFEPGLRCERFPGHGGEHVTRRGSGPKVTWKASP
jgi:hypothetical protein